MAEVSLVKTAEGSTANEGASATKTVSQYEQGSSSGVSESALSASVPSGQSDIDLSEGEAI